MSYWIEPRHGASDKREVQVVGDNDEIVAFGGLQVEWVPDAPVDSGELRCAVTFVGMPVE